MADTDPIETLRRAAEVAPQVLPPATGDVIATYLYKGFRGELDDEWDHVLDVAAEVLALADPGPIQPGPVDLTPEQVEEFKARFDAINHDPPKLLPGLSITREQVDRVASLIDKGVGPVKAFRITGIPVQEGAEHG